MSQDILPLSTLATVAVVVADYDEAIDFYTRKLGFELMEDTQQSAEKRWVVVRPSGGSCQILLAKASTPSQLACVGNQTGGRVFLFLHTTDIQDFIRHLEKHQVKIVRPIVEQPYGKVAVFADLYGNLWDLIEPIR